MSATCHISSKSNIDNKEDSCHVSFNQPNLCKQVYLLCNLYLHFHLFIYLRWYLLLSRVQWLRWPPLRAWSWRPGPGTPCSWSWRQERRAFSTFSAWSTRSRRCSPTGSPRTTRLGANNTSRHDHHLTLNSTGFFWKWNSPINPHVRVSVMIRTASEIPLFRLTFLLFLRTNFWAISPPLKKGKWNELYETVRSKVFKTNF